MTLSVGSCMEKSSSRNESARLSRDCNDVSTVGQLWYSWDRMLFPLTVSVDGNKFCLRAFTSRTQRVRELEFLGTFTGLLGKRAFFFFSKLASFN